MKCLFAHITWTIALITAMHSTVLAQNTNPFAEEGMTTMRTGFPRVDGYSNRFTDVSFHRGLDKYVESMLLQTYREGVLKIATSARFMIEIENEQVVAVDIVECASHSYGSMIQGFLYKLPIESGYEGHFIVDHTFAAYESCDNEAGVSFDIANVGFAEFALENGFYQLEPIHWNIETNGFGRISCFTPNSDVSPKWNDLVIRYVDSLELYLPDKSGTWTLTYSSENFHEEYTSRWTSQLQNGNVNQMEWRLALNQWRERSGCAPYNPDFHPDTVISSHDLPSALQNYFDFQKYDTFELVVHPDNFKILAIICISEKAVVGLSHPDDIHLALPERGCAEGAPIIVKVNYAP